MTFSISSRYLTAVVPFLLIAPALAAPKLRLTATTVGPVSITAGSNGASQSVDAFNAGDGSLKP